MLTNKLASDILSQEDDIECTNDTSEMRKSTFTKANILAPPLERFKAKLNNRSRTSTHITALHAVHWAFCFENYYGFGTTRSNQNNLQHNTKHHLNFLYFNHNYLIHKLLFSSNLSYSSISSPNLLYFIKHLWFRISNSLGVGIGFDGIMGWDNVNM